MKLDRLLKLEVGIKSHGDVCACTMDINHNLKYGNLRSSTLEDIYNSDEPTFVFTFLSGATYQFVHIRNNEKQEVYLPPNRNTGIIIGTIITHIPFHEDILNIIIMPHY